MLSRELVLPWLNLFKLFEEDPQELVLEEADDDDEDTREEVEPE
jgi:hypothetical protein